LKRLPVSILLIAVLWLCALPVGAFSDTEGHWAVSQIERWTEAGVVAGYNNEFRPDDPITRGEAAVILDALMGYSAVANRNYSDLPENAFYTEAVLRLNHAGAMAGYPDGTIHPTSLITRQEAVVMMASALKIPTREYQPLTYLDVDEISGFALPTVATFTQAGYLAGSPDHTFRPTVPMTRAEFVTVLNQIIAQLVPTETVVGTGTMLLINEPDAVVSNTEADTILIASGVGNGTVTLDNVTAETVHVLGGGPNSVVITGNSKIQSIYVARQDGQTRVLITEGAQVDVTYVDDGKNGVILSGKFQSVQITSEDAQVTLNNARIDVVTISGSGVDVTVDAGSSVKTLFVSETATNAQVHSQGSIAAVQIENSSATVVTPEPDPGGSTGGGSSSGGNDGDDDGSGGVIQTVFNVRITILGRGSIFAETVQSPDPDPEPEPEPDPDLDPERYGYPLRVTISGGQGTVLAEKVQDESVPEEPDDTEYILTIEIEGEGTVTVQGGY